MADTIEMTSAEALELEQSDTDEDEELAEANAFSQLSGRSDPTTVTVAQPIVLAAISRHIVSKHSPNCRKSMTLEEEREHRKQMREEKRKEMWVMNFKEAAIHLEEGENGDEFTTIPTNRAKMVFYFMANNRYFNMVLLITSLVNMSLALFEGPGEPLYPITREIHLGVEVACLFFFVVELFVKLQWLGKNYIKKRSLVIKTIILVALIGEVLIFNMFGIKNPSVRMVRACRPYFLLDNRYMRGARDFVSLFFLSLGPVIEMVLLLLFNMLLFAIVGHYLFTNIPDYFETLPKSFLNLFILLTTANFPDVMMPAYAEHPAYSLFFIGYLIIELYLLMNLLFAVVYNKFNESQLVNIKALFRHRRQAAEMAFNLLTTKKEPDSITIQQFEGFMQYFRPRMSRLDIYLTFKAMDDNSGGTIGLTEFYNVYETSRYKWKRDIEKQLPWWFSLEDDGKNFMKRMYSFTCSRMVKFIVYSTIIANTVFVLRQTTRESTIIDFDTNETLPETKRVLNWYQMGFSAVYVVDIALKLLSLGPTAYFSNTWQVFDLITTSCIMAGQILDVAYRAFPYAVFLMPIRIVRFIKLRKLYRQVISTTFSLLDRFRSVIIVVICIYYAYGIIGIELFGEYTMEHCCIGNSLTEQLYSNGSVSGTNKISYHYNNFRNMRNAMVTLFELTVVNNWFVMMEAFTVAVQTKHEFLLSFEWPRIYFMFFYLVMMIVMNMVLSFVVGAFMFQMQYTTRAVGDAIADSEWVYERVRMNEHEKKLCAIPLRVPLKKLHLKALRRFSSATEPNIAQQLRRANNQQTETTYVYLGKRRKRQFEFDMEMHEAELKDWIHSENFLSNLRNSMQANFRAQIRRDRRTHVAQPPNANCCTCPYWKQKVSRLQTRLYKLLVWFVDVDTEKKKFLKENLEPRTQTNTLQSQSQLQLQSQSQSQSQSQWQLHSQSISQSQLISQSQSQPQLNSQSQQQLHSPRLSESLQETELEPTEKTEYIPDEKVNINASEEKLDSTKDEGSNVTRKFRMLSVAKSDPKLLTLLTGSYSVKEEEGS